MPAGHRHQCSLHLWRTYTRKEVATNENNYHVYADISCMLWWLATIPTTPVDILMVFQCCASQDQEDCSWYIPQWRRAWNQWSPPELEGTVGCGWREPWAQTAGPCWRSAPWWSLYQTALFLQSGRAESAQLKNRSLEKNKSAWSVVDPRENQERRWLGDPGKIF